MLKKIVVVLVVLAITGGSIWYFANLWKRDGILEVQGFVLTQADEPVVDIEVKVRLETPEGISWVVCDTVKTDSNGWYHLLWKLSPQTPQETPAEVSCSSFGITTDGSYVLWILGRGILVELAPQPTDDIIVRQDVVL